MTYKSGHHPCEHPRRILEAEGQDLVLEGPAQELKTQKSPGQRVNRNMKVRILQVYWNGPVARWQLWKDHTQGLHPEVLSGNEQIELLEIQNYSKIPRFLGDNENWRQTKIRIIRVHLVQSKSKTRRKILRELIG